jgi:LysM repeat protein
MENDSISSSSSESKLPLIVGIVGFALGAAGLVLALKAKSAADRAGQDATAASAQVADISGQVAAKANAADVAALQSSFGEFKTASDTNNKSFEASIAQLQAVVKSKAVASTKGATAAGPGEYSVAKGDTLGGIAKKVGISLKSLQDLNPGVDATKLRIGQKLKTK